jgi:hypothetical protein
LNLFAASSLPDLCGIREENHIWSFTGGYAYLHRRVPFYDQGGPAPESAFYNYTISRDPGGGQVVARQGDVVLTADPREGSRLLIEAGQNLRVRGWGGSGPGILLHIAHVGVRASSGQVTLRVDARARDLMALDELAARRSETDPAQRILADARQSSTEPDLVTWDAEPPAGILPRTALYRGLWSCVGIGCGAYGEVQRTIFRTSPPSPFAVAVFSRKVTSNWLKSVIGNPLADDGSGWGRMTNSLEVLEANGYQQGWGQ